ncbi:MAG: acyltransferase [Alistipes sp.]|nr:acyltransferase [Alistipes sp.]
MRILRSIYRKAALLRRRLQIRLWTASLRRIAKSCGPTLYVGGKSMFSGEIYLGNNCNFNGMKILGKGKVTIGDNFHSGIECMIITENHDFDTGEALPYGTGFVLKTIVIGDNVWLGNRVLITGNVIIGEGAVLAAGAVVSKDVPPLAIVGGNPARILKYRDKEHYEKLRQQGKFH